MTHTLSIAKHAAKILLVFCFLFNGVSCFASTGDSSKISKKEKLHIKPVPVISYAPETSFLFGVGALATFQLNKDSSTHYSLIAAFVAYTLKKQDYIYVPYQLYSKDNNYYLAGEVDYYNYSYYYWGIGTTRVPQELYDVRFPRIQVNGYRKISPKFYAGIDYYLEDDIIPYQQADSALLMTTTPGGRGSISSGLGLDILFDTRDSIYFPTHGWYINANSYLNYPQLGATSTYGKVIADISWYKKISKPIVLAFNEHTQITWGNAPFNQIALVGGRYYMRGFYTGYYRDNDITILQAEARIHVIGRFGIDVFGAGALLGNQHVFPESNSPIFAEGLGLRYNYDVRQHVNVRFDAGYGKSVEFYLTIQEAF